MADPAVLVKWEERKEKIKLIESEFHSLVESKISHNQRREKRHKAESIRISKYYKNEKYLLESALEDFKDLKVSWRQQSRDIIQENDENLAAELKNFARETRAQIAELIERVEGLAEPSEDDSE